MQDLTLLHWRLASELPFRVLAAWQDDPARPVDVILTVGTVLPHTEEGSGPVHVYVLDDGSALVVAQEIGRFLVSNGGRVIADLVPGVISGAVEMIVIGPVLAALCYQRGLLTLHANTVAINGQAVALCGPSGAGKSTLAAWLATRGQPLVSDDVLPIKRGQSGTIAHTGNRHLRLWRETLVRLGMDADRLERAAAPRDTHNITHR